MKAALARKPALQGLTTRVDDDFGIALLDAAATVMDVLTFYQERIANEGYLRTATERLSLLELARSIGYELRPGVAASTYLAFELESAPGSLPLVSLTAGVRAQSVPAPGELPQTFETIEAIEARVEWNLLKPQTGLPFRPTFTTDSVNLKRHGNQPQTRRFPSDRERRTVEEPGPAHSGIYAGSKPCWWTRASR